MEKLSSMKSVPGAKTLRTADIEDVGYDFEKHLVRLAHSRLGVVRKWGHSMPGHLSEPLLQRGQARARIQL